MREQIDVPFDPDVLYRGSDPDTSRRAAMSIEELRSAHHGLIMDAIRSVGPLTSEEVSDVTPLTHPQAWRRMGELRDAGLLVQTKLRRRNRSGRLAIVWRERFKGDREKLELKRDRLKELLQGGS